LLNQKHQHQPRSDDHDRITKARRAAEALFAAKPPARAPSVADDGAVEQTARKPRVLPIIRSPAPVLSDVPKTSAAPAAPTGKIPRSQFARIRTWVKYGMTVGQAAQVCGVAVAEIERILRHT
jgi:hypothetical protein